MIMATQDDIKDLEKRLSEALQAYVKDTEDMRVLAQHLRTRLDEINTRLLAIMRQINVH